MGLERARWDWVFFRGTATTGSSLAGGSGGSGGETGAWLARLPRRDRYVGAQADPEHPANRRTWDPKEIAEVDDRQAGATVGGAPLPGQVVGLRAADPQETARFFHGQERRDLIVHSTQPPDIDSKAWG